MRYSGTAYGTVKPGNIPNLDGYFQLVAPNPNGSHATSYSTPFYKGSYTQGTNNGLAAGGLWSGGWGIATVGFKASNASAIYSNVSYVLPRGLQIYGWLIKYI